MDWSSFSKGNASPPVKCLTKAVIAPMYFPQAGLEAIAASWAFLRSLFTCSSKVLAMVQAHSNSPAAVFTAWSEFNACAMNPGSSGQRASTWLSMTCHSQPLRTISFKSSCFWAIASSDKKPPVLISSSRVLQPACTALKKVTKWLLETEANLSQPRGSHSWFWDSCAKDLLASTTWSLIGPVDGKAKQTDCPILPMEKPIWAMAAPFWCTSDTDTSCPPLFFTCTRIIFGSMHCWKHKPFCWRMPRMRVHLEVMGKEVSCCTFTTSPFHAPPAMALRPVSKNWFCFIGFCLSVLLFACPHIACLYTAILDMLCHSLDNCFWWPHVTWCTCAHW